MKLQISFIIARSRRISREVCRKTYPRLVNTECLYFRSLHLLGVSTASLVLTTHELLVRLVIDWISTRAFNRLNIG